MMVVMNRGQKPTGRAIENPGTENRLVNDTTANSYLPTSNISLDSHQHWAAEA